MLLGDPRQSDQRTQSFHFPIVVHQSLDPAAQSSAHAPSSLSLHAHRSSSARQAQARFTIHAWVFTIYATLMPHDYAPLTHGAARTLRVSSQALRSSRAQLYFSQRVRANVRLRNALPPRWKLKSKRIKADWSFASLLAWACWQCCVPPWSSLWISVVSGFFFSFPTLIWSESTLKLPKWTWTEMNSSSRPFGLIAVFGTRGSKLHRDRVKKGQAWVAVSSALTEGKMVIKQCICRRRSLQEVVEEVARLLCQREEKDRAAVSEAKAGIPDAGPEPG